MIFRFALVLFFFILNENNVHITHVQLSNVQAYEAKSAQLSAAGTTCAKRMLTVVSAAAVTQQPLHYTCTSAPAFSHSVRLSFSPYAFYSHNDDVAVL